MAWCVDKVQQMSVVQHAGRLRLDGDTPVSLHLHEDNGNTLGWESVIVFDMALLVAVESTTCSYRKISPDSKDKDAPAVCNPRNSVVEDFDIIELIVFRMEWWAKLRLPSRHNAVSGNR